LTTKFHEYENPHVKPKNPYALHGISTSSAKFYILEKGQVTKTTKL